MRLKEFCTAAAEGAADVYLLSLCFGSCVQDVVAAALIYSRAVHAASISFAKFDEMKSSPPANRTSHAAHYCAIDFGTSNSSIAVPSDGDISLVTLEGESTSMPTAVFYSAEDESRVFGRAAINAYVDGHEGRLMRSIKSILGSDLMERTTEVGLGVTVKYIDVVIAYLRQLKERAEAEHGESLTHAVLGRPVFFVDDDAARDRQAEATLSNAARIAGFQEVVFQYEPIAAALDFEQTVAKETLVLVADIGGGTSDFSIVRVGGDRSARAASRDNILANHGVHVAGTDFDREVNLAAIMPTLGFGAAARSGAGVPSRVPSSTYFDLATWHLINTVYTPNRLIELKQMVSLYEDVNLHRRLVTVVEKHLGHDLAARAEAAKIDVSQSGIAAIDLGRIEADLRAMIDGAKQREALAFSMRKIVGAAAETLRLAHLQVDDIGALYFTGGSTGFAALREAIAAVVPNAKIAEGNRYTSVVSGLALHAQRVFA
jgi:hypothetical chaperone protein